MTIILNYHGSKLNAVLRNSRMYSNLLAERLDLTLTLSMRSVLATFPPTTSAAFASRWSQRHILARFMPMALIMCHAELCLSICGRSKCYRAHSRHARSMHCASQATMLLLAPVQVYWTYRQTGLEFCLSFSECRHCRSYKPMGEIKFASGTCPLYSQQSTHPCEALKGLMCLLFAVGLAGLCCLRFVGTASNFLSFKLHNGGQHY